MSKRLPIEIDPFRLIEQRILLEGEMPVKQFPRLKEILSANTGVLKVDLAFDRTNITNLPIVTGHIKGELSLVCQRCLQPILHRVDSELNIVFTTSDKEAERLQSEYDTWAVEDDRIFLQDFIEDEVLLGVPHSALHDDCEPFRPLIEAVAEESDTQQEDVKNPFAILKDLQK
ncbi:MAG: hypothetical protein DSZ29_03340 [Aquificaceae bacterium]|nr:MAG: hypothetical protein DSZ29_03340 [Aquificaceae bacterium]